MKTLTLFVAFFFITFTGCDLFTGSSDDGTPTRKKINNDGIEYTLSIPKTIFSLEDSLSLTFLVQNQTVAIKKFNFNNIQQFGFQLTDDFDRVALYYPTILSPATSSFVLPPGGSKNFSMSYLFKDHSGNFINKGNYVLSAYLSENMSPKVSLQILVN